VIQQFLNGIVEIQRAASVQPTVQFSPGAFGIIPYLIYIIEYIVLVSVKFQIKSFPPDLLRRPNIVHSAGGIMKHDKTFGIVMKVQTFRKHFLGGVFFTVGLFDHKRNRLHDIPFGIPKAIVIDYQ